MADNVAVTAGSGVTIASDDVGGVQYQKVKIDGGGDGVAVPIIAGRQADSASVPAALSTEDVALIGALTETAPATDTASSGLNGRLQRIAQRLTTLITNIGTFVFGGGTEAAAMRVTIASDSTGVLSVDDNGGALTVDNGGTFAVQATVAAGATNIAKAEDDASANADVGIPAMAVRKATPANTSGADGDYEMLQMSAGRLWGSVLVDTALPAGSNAIGKLAANSGVDIGDVDITSVIPGTGATNLGKAEDAAHTSGDVGVFMLGVANEAQSSFAADGDYIPSARDTKGNTLTVGNIAHDGVDAGNPVKIGGKAVSSEPTAVAAGDRANFITDLVGKLINLPYSNPENFVSGVISTAMTGTTSTSLVAAPGAGLRNYITTIIVSNSHASVGTDILIQDGNAGTTLMVIPAAAVYGGAVITLPVPLRQPTANTALYCANVTTGSSTKVSAFGYKGA